MTSASISALQPPHSAVTPRAEARVAPAGGQLNASVRRTCSMGEVHATKTETAVTS
jgi:hypothetical protein